MAVLGTIIALALGLALPRLFLNLAWVEPLSANMAALDWRELSAKLHYESPAPLYFVLLKLWTMAWGESEVALRSLSLLFFVLSLFAISELGRELADERLGLFCALLVALSSSIGISYGVMARFYSLLLLLGVGTLWAWVQLIKNHDTLNLLIFTACSLAGLLCHPLFIFFLIAVSSASAFYGKDTLRRATLAALLAILAYLLLLWDYLCTGFESSLVWIGDPQPIYLRDLLLELWGPIEFGVLMLGVITLSQIAGGARWTVLERRFNSALLFAAFSLMAIPFVLSRYFYLYNFERVSVLLLPLAALYLAGFFSAHARAILAKGALVSVAVLAALQTITVMQNRSGISTSVSLQELVKRSNCGDVWYAFGQGGNEIEYYMRRAAVPACIELRRFPPETANSPGVFFPREWVSVNYDLLLESAEHSVAELAESRKRVYLFVNTRRENLRVGLEDLLQKELIKKFGAVSVLPLRGDQFDQVLLFNPAMVNAL